MAIAIFYLCHAIVWIAIISSVSYWIQQLVRWVRTRRESPRIPSLVSLRLRNLPKWSVADFFVMLGLMVIAFSVIRGLFVTQGWIKPAEAGGGPDGTSLLYSLTANAAAGAVAMAIIVVWVRLVYGATAKDLGLVPMRGDIAMGLKGAFWFIPPVLLLSLLVSVLVPYHHPALESIASAKVAGAWAIMFIGTAIVVPAVEEFMFRVLLQGGLQRFADPQLPVTAYNANEAVLSELETQNDPTRVTSDNPYAPPAERPRVATNASSTDVEQSWGPKRFWPIVVTSILFAAMHIGQGAAPIPLFFLSLGLGYLYRQSGSLFPPLIVHMILNGMTMLVEFSRVASSS